VVVAVEEGRAIPASQPNANNESSEVIDILLPVTFYFNLRPGLIMSKTSDDSLLASRSYRGIGRVFAVAYDH